MHTEGYGITVYPTTFGTKMIDGSKGQVANTISNGFSNLANTLKSLPPVVGREIEAQRAWAELSALALQFEAVYCGTPIGNA